MQRRDGHSIQPNAPFAQSNDWAQRHGLPQERPELDLQLTHTLACAKSSLILARKALGAVSAMRWHLSLSISRTRFHTSGIRTTMGWSGFCVFQLSSFPDDHAPAARRRHPSHKALWPTVHGSRWSSARRRRCCARQSWWPPAPQKHSWAGTPQTWPALRRRWCPPP